MDDLLQPNNTSNPMPCGTCGKCGGQGYVGLYHVCPTALRPVSLATQFIKDVLFGSARTQDQ